VLKVVTIDGKKYSFDGKGEGGRSLRSTRGAARSRRPAA
jgi:hypothetical protein